MSAPQREALPRELHHAGALELHHGDCQGGDEQADAIAVILGIRRIAHPPIARGLRAYCQCEEIRTPAPYLTRNHTIVVEVDRLIATPDGPSRLRSGTWSTIRYARLRQVPIVIIDVNGDVTREFEK